MLFCGSKILTLVKGTMALINKIREKSGVAVVIIAIGLMLFIVGDDILRSFMGGSQSSQEVGEIAGEPINQQEFSAKVDIAKQNYEAQSQQPANEMTMQQIREQVWGQYLVDYGYKKEFDALGIKVSNDELVDMVQGNNISPAIKQSFTNQQTGQFDKTSVVSYLKNLKNMPVDQQKSWESFEKGLVQSRSVQKYENLINMSGYTTKAEAEKEYQAQNTKASLKYLYVPFYSMADTTFKVSDGELESYLSKHKDEYKGFESRSLDYVTFPVIASKDDSLALYSKIKELARGLGAATNDSTFARANSDVTTPLYWSLSNMPEQLKNSINSFIPGSVNGPFREGNTYFIYKYLGTKRDTAFTAKASHILISKQGLGDSAKVAARKKAEGILAQLKSGVSFETLATANSQDPGSAQKGGDLGYFKQGMMVKPFDKAVFAMAGTGLIPTLVESDFGFHIIKVTDAKTNLQYKIAAIGKTLSASQMTRDAAYSKGDQFAQKVKSKDGFVAQAKKDGLAIATASRLPESASNVNTLQNAREIVRWAFSNDTKKDQTSTVFETDEQYVVAALTGKTSKDSPKAEDFKDQLTLKVRNELKAVKISEKLKAATGATLEDVAKKYGAGALVESANDINLANGFLTSAGLDPAALGKGFGLKTGKRSPVFTGENGVFIMEQINKTVAPAIGDYSTYKTSLQQRSQQSGYLISEAIKDKSKVIDNRAKFY